MIRFTIDCDPTSTAIQDGIVRIVHEYGSADGAVMDRFTLVVSEDFAMCAQEALKFLHPMYRIWLVVLPKELLPKGWAVVRDRREGVFSMGCV